METIDYYIRDLKSAETRARYLLRRARKAWRAIFSSTWAATAVDAAKPLPAILGEIENLRHLVKKEEAKI